MKKLWYKPFVAILASTFQMFGAGIYVFTEVFDEFKHLPKLVCINFILRFLVYQRGIPVPEPALWLKFLLITVH
jgi:hypothetical protein